MLIALCHLDSRRATFTPEVWGGIRRRTLGLSAARRVAEERAGAMLQFSLYGILGYLTHYPFLMNRGHEPEERAHFQPAAGDSVYKAKLSNNNQNLGY